MTQERLQREAALQWWGLTVGLKSFDDAWISQGLAEFSAFALRESTMSGAQLENLRRELLEKSLTFEQTASLSRTPANLGRSINCLSIYYVWQRRVGFSPVARNARRAEI